MLGDVKLAIRRIRRRPGFAATFVGILGVTLGISMTVGALADSTIGSALPYDGESELFALSERHIEQEIDEMVSSFASYKDWQSRSRVFEAIGAVRTQLNLALDMPDGAIRVSGAIVSASMFDVLRTRPEIGRSFSADEDRANAGIPVVVLGRSVWERQFGADAEIIGHDITLNGQAWTVVGILPDDATLAPHFRDRVDIWLPLGMVGSFYGGAAVYTTRIARVFQLIGRTGVGATDEEIDQELSVMTRSLAAENPDSSEGWHWQAIGLRARVLRGVDAPIAALSVGAVLLLMVAFVNLVSLYVQRLRADQSELVTRFALGARAVDLSRAGLVELGSLGAVAGLVGAAMCAASLTSMPRWLPMALPGHVNVEFGWRLGLGGLTIAVLAPMAIGLGGLLNVLGNVRTSVASAGRIVGGGAASSRAAQLSLTLQVALTAVLAIGSAVAVRSFVELAATDPGVRAEGVTAFRVDLPEERSPSDVQVTVDELLRSVEELPQVRAAFLWAPHVPGAAVWMTRVRLFDRPDVPDSELPGVRFHVVGAGAVSALGLQIVAGRDMTEDDRTSGRRVVLISASAAKQWWGSEAAAVEQSLRRWSHDVWSEVVGVVADAPLAGRQGEQADFFVDVYFLFGQEINRDLVVLAQAHPGASVLPEDLRRVATEVVPDAPAYDIRTMSDRLSEQDSLSRTSAFLSIVFAMTAIVLAAVGLYGGLSFNVSRRTREIGLRQALGASRYRIVRELVLGNSIVVFVGLGVGLSLAWVLLPMIDPLVLVAGPHHVPSYVLATIVLSGASFVALVAPSLRGAHLSPVESLRDG